MLHRAMYRLTKTAALLAVACLAATVSISAPAHADSDPAAAVTPGDIVRILGGNWKSRVPEPGAIFYEELGGEREVHVYLGNAGGKNVAGLKQSLVANGEPVEDVPGIGTAAMYRPEANEVDVEIARKGATGDDLWLAVIVHNVSDKKATKKWALALAKKAAARL